MIIKWREQTDGGEVEHEFDWAGAPRTKEMRWIKERTEFKTTISFLGGLEEMDPDAIAALLCILCARQGRSMKIDDVDIDPLSDMDFVLSDEEQNRAGLIQKISDGDASETGKAQDAPPVRMSGTSNGALSAVVLKPSSETTLRTSGSVTASTSTG